MDFAHGSGGQKNVRTIAIIGGGAAGLMAAAALLENSFPGKILLFEKNTYLGAKVLISGGGRCNVTTGISDVKDLLKNYPRGAKFLMSAFYRFPPEKVMEWFEQHGVALKIEEDLRVFPKSNSGKDIVGVFEKILHEHDAEVVLGSQVMSIQKSPQLPQTFPTSASSSLKAEPSASSSLKAEPSAFKEAFEITLKDGRIFQCDGVILTTGGNAYRHTGSSGDGYKFAEALGHHITPLAPSLHSFKVAEPWISSLAGISFDKVNLTLPSAKNNVSYTRTGPLLFTHFGVSGPAVFALSSMSAYEIFDRNQPMELHINFFPDEKPEAFEQRFSHLANENGAKYVLNFLDFFVPKSLAQIFVDRAAAAEISNSGNQLQADLKVARLSKEQRKALVRLFFDFSLLVVGRGAGDEFVTAGGVDCAEVESRTMESKICPGLFFAGEILDIDGFTGGFNLQAAWATGKLAGESLAKQAKVS